MWQSMENWLQSKYRVYVYRLLFTQIIITATKVFVYPIFFFFFSNSMMWGFGCCLLLIKIQFSINFWSEWGTNREILKQHLIVYRMNMNCTSNINFMLTKIQIDFINIRIRIRISHANIYTGNKNFEFSLFHWIRYFYGGKKLPIRISVMLDNEERHE